MQTSLGFNRVFEDFTSKLRCKINFKWHRYKKVNQLFLMAFLIMSVASCGDDDNNSNPTPTPGNNKPRVTGLTNAPQPTRSYEWRWDCNQAPCTFRHLINQTASHTFSDTEPWNNTKNATKQAASGTSATYYIHVQAMNTAGLESDVVSSSAILDNKPPSSPTSNNFIIPAVSNNKTPTVTAQGVEAGDVVGVYSDSNCSNSAGTGTVEANQASVEIQLTALTSDGSYSYYAKITDIAGNESNCSGSPVFTYVLDSIPPEVRGLVDNTTPASSISWSWGCSESDCTYRHKVNQVAQYTFTQEEQYNNEISAEQRQGSGTYYLHVQAKDVAGNESMVETVSAILSGGGTVTVTGLTSVTTPKKTHTWQWSCSNLPCTYRHNITSSPTYSFTAGDVFTTTQTASTARLNNPPDGTYYLHVQAQDAANNRSVVAKASVILDNTPPTTPSSLSAVTPTGNERRPQIRVGGVQPGDRVTLYRQANCTGTPQGTGVVPGQQTVVIITPNVDLPSTSGSYDYYARSEDVAGNMSLCSTAKATYNLSLTQVIVTNLMDDPRRRQTKIWTWGCSGTTNLPCTYRYKITTLSTYIFTTADNFSSEVSVSSDTVGSQLNGEYYIHVQARDSHGNESAIAKAKVILDNTPPTVNTPTILNYTPGQNSADKSPTLRITGTLSEGDKVTLYQDTTSSFNCEVINKASAEVTVGANQTSVDVTANQISSNSGTFYFKAQVVDVAGNKSACSAAVTYQLNSSPLPTPTVSVATRGTSRTPVVTVSGVRVRDVVTVYKTTGSDITNACIEQNRAASHQTVSSGTSIQITVNALSQVGTYYFHATVASNTNGDNESDCSNGASYTYRIPGDPIPPTSGPSSLEVLTSQDPDTKLSPVNSPTIRINGVGRGLKLRVYNSEDCTGNALIEDDVPNSDYIPGTGASYSITLPPLQLTGTYHFTAGVSLNNGREQCSHQTANGQDNPPGILQYTYYKPLATGGHTDDGDSTNHDGGHTCYLFKDGRVLCWGANDVGQLGKNAKSNDPDTAQLYPPTGTDDRPYVNLGDDGDATTPVKYTAKSVATGGKHSCAILNTGDVTDAVKCWGLNTSGQLGQNNIRNHGSADSGTGDPVKCRGDDTTTGLTGADAACSVEDLEPIVFSDSDYKAKAITAGAEHTCMIIKDDVSRTPNDDGKVLCWGNNRYGQLGQDDTDNHGSGEDDTDDVDDIDPISLGSSNGKVKIIVAGDYHNCVILQDDQVMCWGLNASGQLGLGSTENKGDEEDEMQALSRINLGAGRTAKDIVAGKSHTCVLLDNDTVKCWGLNTSGQLGKNDTSNFGDRSGDTIAGLSTIDLGSNYKAKAVSAGGDHTCVTLNNDQIKCFGENESGQLGQDDMHDHGSGKRQTDDVDELDSIVLGCGSSQGENDGSTEDDGTTCSTDHLPFKSEWVAVGGQHTCALLTTSHSNSLDQNALKCWGNNMYGQLGSIDTESSNARDIANHGSGSAADTSNSIPAAKKVFELRTVFQDPPE